MPAHVGFLDDVFGVGARAEHAIREAEEPAAHRFECRDRGSRLCHVLFSSTRTDDWRACDTFLEVDHSMQHVRSGMVVV